MKDTIKKRLRDYALENETKSTIYKIKVNDKFISSPGESKRTVWGSKSSAMQVVRSLVYKLSFPDRLEDGDNLIRDLISEKYIEIVEFKQQ